MATQEKTMTTHDVANRLLELCRQGQVLEAEEELFHDEVTTIAPDMKGGMVTTHGKAENIAKGKEFAGMMEEVHSAHISEPVIAGNWFSISWTIDVTMKGMGRQTWSEICVYQIKDGKIFHQQFFS